MSKSPQLGLPGIVVCDSGSGVTKAGLSTDAFPRLVMPTLVGRPVVRDHARYSRHIFADENVLDEYLVLRSVPTDEKPKSVDLSGAHVYIGNEAKQHQSLVDLSCPIRSGVVKNWEDMERVWSHVFKHLKADEQEGQVLTPSNRQQQKRKRRSSAVRPAAAHSVVLTESVEEPFKNQREKTTEMMFETFLFERVNMSASAALILAARGTSSGIIVECGDGITEIIPVSNGYVQKGSVRKTKVGGRAVTERLIDLLKRSDGSNYRLDADRDFYLIEKLKEKLCYIATDLREERYVAEKTNALSATFSLPDRTSIVINKERFLGPEILFQPQFMGDASSDCSGISGLVEESISSCAIDLRAPMYKSIILSGGSTLLPGFGDRIRSDLRAHKVMVDEAGDRLLLPFQGGAALAQLHQSSTTWWMDKKEYDEVGPYAIHRLFNFGDHKSN